MVRTLRKLPVMTAHPNDTKVDEEEPPAPFILGQLGQWLQDGDIMYADRWKYANNAMVSLANIPGILRDCLVVNSEGLAHIGDNLHFSAEAARELGRRYAAAYHDIVVSRTRFTTPDM